MDDLLRTYVSEPASGGPAQNMVILLHGLGSNGRDLISLAPEWARDLPDTLFISPDAPFPCDMAPVGYQWFSLQVRTPEVVLAGVQKAAPILEDYIAWQIEKRGISADKTALVGFSQGTMMSLYEGPRYKDKLAGVLGYSGALVWPDDTDNAALHKLPVRLIHGDADDVVPVTAYYSAKERLEQAGFDVSGNVTPGLYHGIDGAGIASGAHFLRQIFA